MNARARQALERFRTVNLRWGKANVNTPFSFESDGPYHKRSFMESFGEIEQLRKDWVEKTQHGLLALSVGAIITSLPIIRPAGSFVTLIGIVLLVLGRHRFGNWHTRFIAIGSLLFAVSTVLLVISSVGYILLFSTVACFYPTNDLVARLVGDCYSDAYLPRAMIRLTSVFLALDFGGSLFSGASFAVLTVYLQDWRRRGLLLLGFA